MLRLPASRLVVLGDGERSEVVPHQRDVYKRQTLITSRKPDDLKAFCHQLVETFSGTTKVA